MPKAKKFDGESNRILKKRGNAKAFLNEAREGIPNLNGAVKDNQFA